MKKNINKKPVSETISPYKVFWDWIYDGNMKSKIPTPTDKIPDILKYNSPITSLFLLRSFLKCGKANYFLNSYLNNMGIRSVDTQELFLFIKQFVKNYNISKYDIFYFQQFKQSTKLYEILSKRCSCLKSYEISQLCDIIDSSDNKEVIYTSFGLDVPKKQVIKSKVKKNKKLTKISLDDFLKNFSLSVV